MSEDELRQLKNKIIEAAVPLITEGSGTDEERLNFMFNILQAGGANAVIYKTAYDTIMKIEDPETKLNALLRLLEEVEVGLDVIAIDEPDESVTESVASEPFAMDETVATETSEPQPLQGE